MLVQEKGHHFVYFMTPKMLESIFSSPYYMIAKSENIRRAGEENFPSLSLLQILEDLFSFPAHNLVQT